MAFNFWDIGECNCPSGITMCGCTDVPTTLTMSSVIWGVHTLTYQTAGPFTGFYICPTFDYDYPGGTDGFGTTCAPVPVMPMFFLLDAATCRLGMDFKCQAFGDGCPDPTGTATCNCGYGVPTITCSPFELVFTLPSANICAFGTAGDTATITP